jgi:hypothetical protein
VKPKRRAAGRGDREIAESYSTVSESDFVVDYHRLSRGKPSAFASAGGWAEVREAAFAGTDAQREVVIVDHAPGQIAINRTGDNERSGGQLER